MSYPKRNFYEILNASSSSASFDEIKSNYKQLILQCHPDKLQQQFEIETTNNVQINYDPNNLEFIAITEAWNCLKDPIKRKQYDAEQLLRKFHTHNNIYAHLKLNEMKKQPNTEEYFEEEEGDVDDVHGVHDSKEKSNNKDGVSKYIYTYDCRCGGQYIVDDESAEQQYCRPATNNHVTQSKNSDDNNGVQDDADNKTNNGSGLQSDKNRPDIIKNTNNAGGGSSSSSCNSCSRGNNINSTGAGGNKGVALDNADDDDHGAVDANADADADVDFDDEEEGGAGGELIVECSECSLVIILNG